MDRDKTHKRSDWTSKTSDVPANEHDETVSAEKEASRAVSNAFDKHKAELEKELKKLSK